jgi:hypothetical protein
MLRPALVAAGALTAGFVARRASHTWGSTSDEHAARLPGDDLVAEPAIVATRAVTIDASASEVWSWLVQIGQNRGGMYSYDALENLLGLHIHSTDTIRPEWQRLEVGDRIVLVPRGWAGLETGYELPVAEVAPPHRLVLRQSPPEHPWDAVWSFHLRSLPDGGTRLVSRSRSHRHTGPRALVDLAVDSLMDPVTWVMTRKMLLGIKARAERRTVPAADRSRSADGQVALRRRLERDVDALETGGRAAGRPSVDESHLDALPEPAQRYLRWMGVPGQPSVTGFRVRFHGEFRMKPGQRWMPYEAWQYNRIDPVTRLARMRIDVAGVVPMFGSDTYVDRHGRMLGKVLGLVTVADGEGPEFDLGELVTFVNDAFMIAPSMLLTPATDWRPVDDATFDVVFSDGGNTVTARCTVDEDGRPTDFTTHDRWYAGTNPPTRTGWSTPLDEWVTRPDGRRLPRRGSALWHLPDGEFTYVRGAFDPASLTIETAPAPAHAPVERA